jgi:hypothetical protein
MADTELRAFRTAQGEVPLFEWLAELDGKIRKKCIARIRELAKQGFRLQPPLAKPLRDGIIELRPKTGRVNYRILYFFHNRKAILTHGLTKEGKVPDEDIHYAIACREAVRHNESAQTTILPTEFFQ